MKILLLIILLSLNIVYAQSPYFSIKFSVIDKDSTQNSYQIISRECNFNYKPVIRSGDYWFGKDTSALNWDNLPDSMYRLLECSREGITPGMHYENSNQDMVWERIYSFTVIKNKTDSMRIVFPVLIKSFVTFINLGKIYFLPGTYFELINEFDYKSEKGSDYLYLSIPENFVWKNTSFEKRKIKIK